MFTIRQRTRLSALPIVPIWNLNQTLQMQTLKQHRFEPLAAFMVSIAFSFACSISSPLMMYHVCGLPSAVATRGCGQV